MNFRNPKYNEFGTIDCEIEHPVWGWIPFTADPSDVEPLGAQVFNAARPTATEYVAPVEPPLSPAELIDTYRQALQARIDATARERGYENGYALASYALSTIPEWRAEAEAFIAWRDRAWVEALDAAAQVEAGTLPAEDMAAVVEGRIPTIGWPPQRRPNPNPNP